MGEEDTELVCQGLVRVSFGEGSRLLLTEQLSGYVCVRRFMSLPHSAIFSE